MNLRTLIFLHKMLITCVFKLIIRDHFPFETHVGYHSFLRVKEANLVFKINISFLSTKKIQPKVTGASNFFLLQFRCQNSRIVQTEPRSYIFNSVLSF